jgi:aspartate aminotransferase
MRNRARQLRAQGVHVVNFAAGELDQDTSPLVKEAARRAVDAGRTQYTEALGLRELRERLGHKTTLKTGTPYTADEVGFTAGAKQALFSAAFVAFQPGDEVLIPAPYWVTFPEQIRLAGATPVFVPTAEHHFQLDAGEVRRRLTPRTRGIVLNTPHNPTGVVYGADVLEKVARLVLEHHLTCIFDECYDELVYAPAAHVNVVKLEPAMKERTILVGSFSKTYCLAGWRAGFLAGPAAVIQAVANLQSHVASNPCNLVQYAVLAALEPENDGFVTEIREQLRARRALALEALEKVPGLSCVVPAGAFYLFPDVGALFGTSLDGRRVDDVDVLAEMLLEHAHIAVVPGSAFGSDRHVRLSYAIPADDVVAGLGRLERFVRRLA